MRDRCLKVGEVAAYLAVGRECVYGYIASGRLVAFKLSDGPRGKWRVTPEALRDFCAAEEARWGGASGDAAASGKSTRKRTDAGGGSLSERTLAKLPWLAPPNSGGKSNKSK